MSEDGVPDIVFGHHVEHNDRDAVVHAERKCCGIHDLEALGECFAVGDFVVFYSGRVLLWVRSVDAVYFGCLQDGFGSDFAGTEGGGGVGGEEGVPCSCDENDYTSVFEVAHGATPDKGFSDALDGDRGLDSCGDAKRFEGRLKGHSVDDGGKHTHVIGSSTFHAFMAGGEASPDISATHDDGEFHAHGVYVFDLLGDLGHDLRRNGFQAARFLKGFSADFEYNTAVVRDGRSGVGVRHRAI